MEKLKINLTLTFKLGVKKNIFREVSKTHNCKFSTNIVGKNIINLSIHSSLLVQEDQLKMIFFQFLNKFGSSKTTIRKQTRQNQPFLSERMDFLKIVIIR